jgi:hypothetical protein
MQDYDFWGHGTLSYLLLRQLSFGASIRVMTTPPPGRPTTAGFKDKYTLLSALERKGIQVFLNDKLHAKAYLFLDANDGVTAIIGSANLTGPGFGRRLTPNDNLVEMAMALGRVDHFKDATAFIDDKIANDKRTEDFATWFSRNSLEIGKAGL